MTNGRSTQSILRWLVLGTLTVAFIGLVAAGVSLSPAARAATGSSSGISDSHGISYSNGAPAGLGADDHAILRESPLPPQAPAQATMTPGTIVVRGRLFYTDRFGDKNHPAAGLRVEIWDLDSGFPTTSQLLDTTTTDINGFFQSKEVSNVDRDGPTGAVEGTQDVFLKLYTNNGKVKLLRTGTTQEFVWNSYEINQANGIKQNVPDGMVGFPTQFIVENTKDVAAMWTFVNLAEAWLYMQKYTGEEPGEITAYWSPDSLDGPRYDIATKTLYFRDEDAGYHTVIIQYTAYALLHNIYGTLPAGWDACIASPPADPRIKTSAMCALVHGFAMFLPLAVYENPEYQTPTTSLIDMDMAKAGTPGWQDGDLVPGRIVGAFWDLHENDLTEEEYDKFDASFADIWEVFDKHSPNTMAEWWTGWKALGKNGCTAVGSLFQNTINYNTPPTIQPIPDIVLNEDETAFLDLKNYVNDTDCADDTMVFTMIDAGAPEAGVKLMPTNVISVTPQANWFGDTTVRINVSDGLVSVELSFKVIVKSVNDCVQIVGRIPDPAPATSGQTIVLRLETFGRDTEDAPGQLKWRAEVEPQHAGEVTVAGNGTTVLTFMLNINVDKAYSARVKVIVTDLDGCEASQNLVLFWTDRLNHPPVIDFEKLQREYIAAINTKITVDLTGVASDQEDPPHTLDWFVTNLDDLDAQVNKMTLQIFDFEPDVGFIGSNRVEIEVQDSGGARATADITLTWRSQLEGNLPPRILRQKLLGKTAGIDAEICYELTDKAVDPDDSQYALRWFIKDFDDTLMFVGAQGTRNICMRPRTGYEGCVTSRFVVTDPRDASDSHLIDTCWRTVKSYLPFAVQYLR
jgi:hypothetical protein